MDSLTINVPCEYVHVLKDHIKLYNAFTADIQNGEVLVAVVPYAGAESHEQAKALQTFVDDINPDMIDLFIDINKQLDKQLADPKSPKDKEIINRLDPAADWDDIINEIKNKCKVEAAEYITMKIVQDVGYRRKDVHVPNPSTRYVLTSDMYDELSDIVEGEDCKNGCQLMQEPDGTYYFQITGANFYDKEGRYAGTNTVKIWFKELKW